MARAALVWSEDDHLRLAELEVEAATKLIGRASDATVTLNDKTVSRNHAQIRSHEGMLLIENLSQTNPTKVNDVVIDRPVPLSDGDVAELGAVRLVFHDLAAADRTSGPICSHCSRENLSADKKCWYCGTFLVNAPTVIIERRTAACRIVSASGAHYDLHEGEAFVIHPGGAGEVLRKEQLPADRAAAVELRGGKPVLALSSGDAPLTLNGQPASDGRALQTGDELRAWDEHLLLIVR